MEFTITKDIQNELLSRREIEFILEYDGATPSRVLVLGKLAALMNSNMDQVVIDSFRTSFGIPRMHGAARIYTDSQTRDTCEIPYLVRRGKKDEPDTGEAKDAPANAATAEALKEQTKASGEIGAPGPENEEA